MPSFLNKVFGYKKHDDKEPARTTADQNTLLDGKYEAIPHTLFPSAPLPDRDVGFSLFKPKARASPRRSPVVPHLTLKLKENIDSRALSGVFDPDPDSLDDAVIADKRLTPLEALSLIRACARTIAERGLETLGIMHPHWFSASPEVQRKLISLFIRSQSRSAFEHELRFARSPHDVAAVLRWGLRHLTLENARFGKDPAEWAWYGAFFRAERNASYPPKAFSELLLPQLPPAHVELLTATLDLISSLASHAETNSISGSKLSKFLGIWLLVASRAEELDDWSRFYARWERAGRILEHLFLARLREESFALRLPTRLQELVAYYPYSKGSPTTEDDLLSRPRFSTRQYDALCVRVETVLAEDGRQPKQHPIRLLLDAFQLPIDNLAEDDRLALWTTLKTRVFEDAPSLDGPQFIRIFVDETMQLLSSIPTDNIVLPTLLASPIAKVVSRKRSSSLSRVLDRALSMSTPTSPTLPSSPVVTDWAQFSLSGFGDAPSTQPLATILNLDEDAEITQPRISRKSSRQRGKSRSRRRDSHERERSAPLQLEPESAIIETKLASVHMVQIDEAFIDCWSDAVVDPISANWPVFVLCGLKETPNVEQPIRWLVIEQTYTRQESLRNPSPEGRRGRSPRPSFKSDISGFRINSMFTSARKRFSVFNKSSSELDTKKTSGRSPITGELGEVVVEEEPTFSPASADQNAHVNGGAAVDSGVTAHLADQLKANEICTTPVASLLPVGFLKATSVELTSQSGGCNGSSALPGSIVEKTANPRVDNVAGPIANDIVAARDRADSLSRNLTARTSRSAAENSVGQIRAEQVLEGGVLAAGARPVELIAPPADGANGDQRIPSREQSNMVQIEVTDHSDSRKIVETVAMAPAPERVEAKSIARSAAVAVADEEPHVDEKAPDDMATFAAQSVDPPKIDHLAPPSAAHVEDKVIHIETSAQLEPDGIISVADGAEETKGVAEQFAEIPTPTPAPGHLALVEETPGGDCDVGYGRAGSAQTLAAELEGMVPQSVTAELQATLEAQGSSVTPKAPSIQIDFIVAEHAAEQVSEFASKEASCSAEAPAVVQAEEGLLVPEFKVKVPTGNVSAMQSIGIISTAEPSVVKTWDEGVPTPVLENATLVDETPGLTEEDKPIEASTATKPRSEAVRDEVIPEAEVLAPTQVLAAPASIRKGACVAVNGIIADKPEARSMSVSGIDDPDVREAVPVGTALGPVEGPVKTGSPVAFASATEAGENSPSVPLSVHPAVSTDPESSVAVPVAQAPAEADKSPRGPSMSMI